MLKIITIAYNMKGCLRLFTFISWISSNLAKYTFLGEISPFFQIKVLQKKYILLRKFPVSRKQKNSPQKEEKLN